MDTHIFIAYYFGGLNKDGFRDISHNDNASTIYGLTLGDLYKDNIYLSCRRAFAKNCRYLLHLVELCALLQILG